MWWTITIVWVSVSFYVNALNILYALTFAKKKITELSMRDLKSTHLNFETCYAFNFMAMNALIWS